MSGHCYLEVITIQTHTERKPVATWKSFQHFETLLANSCSGRQIKIVITEDQGCKFQVFYHLRVLALQTWWGCYDHYCLALPSRKNSVPIHRRLGLHAQQFTAIISPYMETPGSSLEDYCGCSSRSCHLHPREYWVGQQQLGSQWIRMLSSLALYCCALQDKEAQSGLTKELGEPCWFRRSHKKEAKDGCCGLREEWPPPKATHY